MGVFTTAWGRVLLLCEFISAALGIAVLNLSLKRQTHSQRWESVMRD